MVSETAPVTGETAARLIVEGRSGGVCEACGRPATNFAHRCARSGGGLWIASNGIRLCGSGTTGCHGWATLHPIPAEVAGWRVLSGEHPADVPAWLRSPYLAGWHILGDDGTIEPLWDRTDVPELPSWVTATRPVPRGKSQR